MNRRKIRERSVFRLVEKGSLFTESKDGLRKYLFLILMLLLLMLLSVGHALRAPSISGGEALREK